MKPEDIHIGSIIRQKVRERELSVSAFARAIHCSRTNVHSIFKRKSIDVDLLIRISAVLEFDFLKYYDKNKEDNYVVIVESNKAFLETLLYDDEIRVLGFYKM